MDFLELDSAAQKKVAGVRMSLGNNLKLVGNRIPNIDIFIGHQMEFEFVVDNKSRFHSMNLTFHTQLSPQNAWQRSGKWTTIITVKLLILTFRNLILIYARYMEEIGKSLNGRLKYRCD